MDHSTLDDLTSHYPTEEDVIELMTSDTLVEAATRPDLPCVHHILSRK